MWEEKLKSYDKFIAKCSRFERKGKTMPYTSANGHMFSLYNKIVRSAFDFQKQYRKNILKKNTTLYKSYGATIKGHILITEQMLTDLDIQVFLLDESYDYVMSLDPNKPMKKLSMEHKTSYRI